MVGYSSVDALQVGGSSTYETHLIQCVTFGVSGTFDMLNGVEAVQL